MRPTRRTATREARDTPSRSSSAVSRPGKEETKTRLERRHLSRPAQRPSRPAGPRASKEAPHSGKYLRARGRRRTKKKSPRATRRRHRQQQKPAVSRARVLHRVRVGDQMPGVDRGRPTGAPARTRREGSRRARRTRQPPRRQPVLVVRASADPRGEPPVFPVVWDDARPRRASPRRARARGWDALVTAFRNRTRSATYPRQSSKSQLMPYLPSANRARARRRRRRGRRRQTPRARDRSGPRRRRRGPRAQSGSPGCVQTGRRVRIRGVQRVRCLLDVGRLPVHHRRSLREGLPGDARVTDCCPRSPRPSASARRPAHTRRHGSGTRPDPRRGGAMPPRAPSPPARGRPGVCFAKTLLLNSRKAFPGLALGSVRATSRVSITTNEMTSPKCTVRLYANGPFCLSDQFPTFVGSRVGNHSWYARIAARSRVAYAPSRSGWWFSPPFVPQVVGDLVVVPHRDHRRGGVRPSQRVVPAVQRVSRAVIR